MITFKNKGDFSKVTSFLTKAKKSVNIKDLQRYGEEGVAALSSATPVDTGLTASSWFYTIEQQKGGLVMNWCNSNIQNEWCNVAIIIQLGHGTKNGGWVEGRDYINPAIQPIFDKIANDLWEGLLDYE